MIKYFIILTMMVSLGWGSYYSAHQNYYPIALVNWRPIMAQQLDQAFSSSLGYYGKLKKQGVSDAAFAKEIKRAALDKLIENTIVMHAVASVDVDNQLAAILAQNKDLEKNSVVAYGIAWAQFKDFVLRPQIAAELLQKKFKTTKNDYDQWLVEQKKSARVFLLTSGFHWTGERVENG